MNRLRTRLTTLARFGLLLALLALGVTLVFSAWSNRRAAEQISALLERGQSELFFRPIPELHERNHGPATQKDLEALLQQFRPDGLRYVSETDINGKLVAEAGDYVGSERPRPDAVFRHIGVTGQPIVKGDRVRVTFHPPRHAAGGGLGDQSRPPPLGDREPPDEHRPPDDRGPPDDHGPPDQYHSTPPPGPPPAAPMPLPDLVMEFVPTVANQLRDRADKSFVFSITAAASLLALTLGLWLSLVREQRGRDRSERERHLAALGEMSAVLAHEIRNPLASLKGHAQLLGEQLDSESPLQKKVGRIVDEAKRLEDLSGTLLDLVRSSSVSRTAIDPAQLVRDAARDVDAARILVESDAAPATWPLDALRMAQVLRNLLQNAAQASPDPQSRIEVSVGSERGKLSIVVRDHGEGLSPGSERKIFEAFHTTRVKGTGLGLAVARRVVELHGGKIQAENHPNGGAVFTLTIPD